MSDRRREGRATAIPVPGFAAKTPAAGRRAATAGRPRSPRPAARGTILLVALVALAGAGCSNGGPSQGAGSSTITPGSPWSGRLAPVALPAPVNSLGAVDCVDDTHCWAVGSTTGTGGAPNGAAVVATANGGRTWVVQPIPPTAAYLAAISCSDRRHCAAVGQAAQTSSGQGAVVTTVNGGSTWTAVPVPAGVLDVTAVACGPDRHCLALGATATGTAAIAGSPSRAAWVQRGMLPDALTGATGVSCPDSRHCWVTAHADVDVDHVTGRVALTTDGGSTWARTSDPVGVGYLNGIDCAGQAGGRGGLPFTATTAQSTTGPAGSSTASADPPAGSTTTAPGTAQPPGTTTTTAPAGVPGAWCVAVGTTATTVTGTRSGRGVVLTTADGGASWSSQPVAPSAAALMGVSCISLDSCVAVGSAVALEPHAGVAVVTGPAGHPWRGAAALPSTQALTGVSCTTTSRCVVVGESISEHLVGAS